MNTRRLFVIAMVGLSLLASCGPSEKEEADTSTANSAGDEMHVRGGRSDEVKLIVAEQALGADPGLPAVAPPSSIPRERMIIKTANLELEVAEYDKAQAEVQRIAIQAGGFVASTNVFQMEADRKSGSIVIRVPAKVFDQTIASVKAIAKTVQSESINGNDITEEFYDLTARLENKKRAEQRFLEILRSAKNAKEILEVEQALMGIREEIERLEGRKRYLTDQTDLSTISITMYEPASVITTGPDKFWSRLTQALGNGFERGMNGVFRGASAFLAFIIAVLPPVIIVWLVYKLARRIYQKRQPRSEE